jgi:hypothetical protein
VTPILGVIDSAKTGNLSTTAFDSIATVTASANQSLITFTGIPATYRHLQLRGLSRGHQSNPNDGSGIYMRFNSDTGGNFGYQRFYCVRGISNNNGASDSGANQSFADCGIATSASQTADIFGGAIVDVLDYAIAGKKRSANSFGGFALNSNASNQYTHFSQLSWNDTAAVTRIDIVMGVGSFAANSTWALYGVKG